MSVHFFGFPARRDEAQPSRCNEEQRSWGAEKVCDHVRSALSKMVNVKNTSIFYLYRRFIKLEKRSTAVSRFNQGKGKYAAMG